MRSAWRSWMFVAVAACSGDASDKPSPTTAPTMPADAGGDHVATPELGSGARPTTDGTNRTPTRAGQKHEGRPIELVLRSTPGGARVTVNGVALGPTPAFWEGETGNSVEVAFELEGYAPARYKFVPVTSGVIHPRLDPVGDEPRLRAPNAQGSAAPSTVPVGAAPPPPIVIDAAVPPPIVIDAAPSVPVTLDAATPTSVGPQP